MENIIHVDNDNQMENIKNEENSEENKLVLILVDKVNVRLVYDS